LYCITEYLDRSVGAELRENRGTSAALSAVSTNPFDEDSDEEEAAK